MGSVNSVSVDSFTINVEREFPSEIAKASFPLRYGICSEVRTPEYEFWFNLNGEVKFIRGINLKTWPRPAEQLKRTDGNDWVYYSVGDTGGDRGLISWLGEYYLPCLPYPSNSVWEDSYLSDPGTMKALAAWSQLYANLFGIRRDTLPPRVRGFVDRVLENDEGVLHQRANQLHSIIGGRVSVLPPDTRHVDYEVIPLMIADGCLYHCEFCCVKSDQRFRPRPRENILEQIRQLKDYYGRNLENYHALFLGNHDALAAGEETICLAAADSVEGFGFGSRANPTRLYMFGSVDSLLRSGERLFEKLDGLPYFTCINVGLESVDAPTLAMIQKPLSPSKVSDAFQRMLDINSRYANIEVTANFLLGDQLSPDHYQSLAEMLRGAKAPPRGKGAVYLSPLKDSPKKRELLPRFYEIREHSRLPAYIYLIQRL